MAEELQPRRRPMAWHNVITDCGDLNGCDVPGHPPNSAAGVPSTIVEVYSSGNFASGAALLANSTGSGYLSVMADACCLYLDTGSPDPKVYSKSMWYDIARGLPADGRALVLGGSLSLWSDNYCSGTVECGGWAYCPGSPWPAGAPFPTSGGNTSACVSGIAWMQEEKHDDAFILSAGGLLFPRANVGAGAFWNFRPDLAHDSAEVTRRTAALAATMKARQVTGLCPQGCTCSFGSRCGKAYAPSSSIKLDDVDVGAVAPTSCTAALGALCGRQRSGVFACAECAGVHQAALRSAGCSNNDISRWCARAAPSAPTTPPPVRWAKGYTFGGSESHPHAGVQTSDGGFLVVGDGVDYQNETVKRHMMVLKTDKDGNAQWQRTFGDNVAGGYNYGKFGIQIPDGSFLIAGAMSTNTQPGTGGRVLLQRTLLHLSGSGSLLQRLSLPNTGWRDNLRDGFMCVALGEDSESVVATGFVGGENATTGGVDEPMFLVGGGQPFAMKLTLRPRLAVAFDMTIEAAPGQGFTPQQGMRLFYDAKQDAYVVSHTVRFPGDGGAFQFGLTSIAGDGSVNWVRAYKAEASATLHGHASHPYALTQGHDGGYAIGGLAVIFDAKHIEQCQGRLLKVDPSGNVVFDRRFTSTEKDTNIECYGLQPTPDAGFILTCGTGVEPELHPKDSQRSKTWRVLVHRTDARGVQVWQKAYTDNSKLKDNAGEYIVTTRSGEYAVYVDSQTYGSPSTGGNFAIMLLGADTH